MRRTRIPGWVASVLIAAPVLAGVSLPPEPSVTGVVFSPYGCVPRPWNRLTPSEQVQCAVAPLLQRRQFHFAPTRPPFPPVV